LPGLLPDSDYTATRIPLAPGERLALFTDGLTESADTPRRRSTLDSAIREAMGRQAALAAQPMAESVMALFDRLAGEPPPDDALLLVAGPGTAAGPAHDTRPRKIAQRHGNHQGISSSGRRF
jgi:serine phosphatase RsbU (regulator of sigma subunit)